MFDASNVPRDIFDSDGILDRQAMTLAFYPGFVDQHSSVSIETYGHDEFNGTSNSEQISHRRKQDRHDRRA